jgi:hypothetical protein
MQEKLRQSAPHAAIGEDDTRPASQIRSRVSPLSVAPLSLARANSESDLQRGATIMSSTSDWTSWIERAKSADMLRVAQDFAVRVKKIGANEYAGPCPSCGGDDRFSISTKKNVFNCRGCGAKGSNLDLVMLATGCSLIEAAERIIGEQYPDHSRDEEAKQERDQQAIEDIRKHAIDLNDPRAEHGKNYFFDTRGLVPEPSLIRDIKYVEAVNYYGYGDDGAGESKLLDTLSAISAVIRDHQGHVTGLQLTYLDPTSPTKWKPIGSERNSAKKIRGRKQHGMIRLGPIFDRCLGLCEGWENGIAFRQLGLGPAEISLAAAVDLGNSVADQQARSIIPG